MNLVCIRHPEYDGAASPVLSCKVCCSIFLAEVRSRQFGSGAELPANNKQGTEQVRNSLMDAIIQTL
ncbi:MAG: hypothetical protein NTY08_03295 [Proteobacteria bacterium]|jgi:hypothetical protein|nr:hypothetical protein [Pseudomonadota bacterium]